MRAASLRDDRPGQPVSRRITPGIRALHRLAGLPTLGIVFGGGVEAGPFEFLIDDFRLETTKAK